MDQMDAQAMGRLARGGVDAPDALNRLMGREDLLVRFLKEFARDPSYPALLAAVERGDRGEALTAAHTLKGLCGNLSMTELYDLFTRQVALLRGEDWQGACALLPRIEQARQAALSAIADALG